MAPQRARVVQISDTHFRSTLPPPEHWRSVVDWLAADPPDPAAPRRAFERATAGADVRVVACGHRHCSFHAGRAVWAPSLTLTGTDAVPGADPRPGVVEHTLSIDGGHDHRVVRPWALSG